MSSTSRSSRAYRRAVAKTRGEYFWINGSKLAGSPWTAAAINSASVRSIGGTMAEGFSPTKAKATALENGGAVVASKLIGRPSLLRMVLRGREWFVVQDARRAIAVAVRGTIPA